MVKGASFYEKAELLGDFLRENNTSEADAINAGDLCVLFNCHKQDLRRFINHLRRSGIPICSSNNGYWYSEKIEDIDSTLIALKSRIGGINRAIEGLEECRDMLQDIGD